MAFNQIDVNFASVALTAATAKSVVGVKAAANVALKLLETVVSLDGATSTAVPTVTDFARSTFATNSPGTSSTSFTMANGKRDPGRAETVQATAATNWTSEPTVLTALDTVDIAQYNGTYHYINPFASPHIIAGGQGFVIRINSPAGVNASGRLTIEE